VSPTAVYRHFENRDALLAEIAATGFERLRIKFSKVVDLHSSPSNEDQAIERLTRLGYTYLKFAFENESLWRLMFSSNMAEFRSLPSRQNNEGSYAYLPVVLQGLYDVGVMKRKPNQSDLLFAWSAIHGVCSLRLGQISVAKSAISELNNQVAKRIVCGLAAS
jgi:AcrR family transcriptional regulator